MERTGAEGAVLKDAASAGAGSAVGEGRPAPGAGIDTAARLAGLIDNG